MLSGHFNLFSKKNYNKARLGGPRSFHKFRYKNKDIILIGEAHIEMNSQLAQEYISIFDKFIELHHVKLFIEKVNKKENEEKSSGGAMSFIDCMGNLNSSSHLKVINSDDRQVHLGFERFFYFLVKMQEVEELIIEKIKEQKLKLPASIPFPSEEPLFMKEFEKLYDDYDIGYSFFDLMELLSSSITTLDKLHEQYSKMNSALGDYISGCILHINDALGLILQFQTEYASLEHNKQKEEKEIENTSIIKACIELMKHKNTFSAAVIYANVYILYVANFLDATLICKLYDEINNDEQDKILMVVAGNEHTDSLTNFFKKLCKPAVSVDENPKGSILSPEVIDNFLKDNFKHAPSKGCCALM